MAVLSDADRAAVWRDVMRQMTDTWGTLTKADIRAAVNAWDQYFNDNAAQVNNVFPQPFRGQATTKQKAMLLAFVLMKRYAGGI